MNILIIEDEQPASDRLIAMVKEFDPSIHVVAVLRSVNESIDWLKHHSAPDLILADIQLGDGLSLEIFNQHTVLSPLIFTTAYDEYLLKAFEFNSIDYLLKPIDKNKLHRALTKYSSLQQHFSGNVLSLLQQLHNTIQYKERIVVKKGTDFVALNTEQIAYFFTEHKVSFLVDREGKRYLVDKPLAEIEAELDNKIFFRINRKYIAAIHSIVKFRSLDKGKLLLDLTPPVAEEVIVSQENSAAFKEWMGK